MSEKISLARLKKFGKTFELSVNPDSALAYKKGAISDLNEAVLSEHIFTDARKGLIAPAAELEKVFKTTEFAPIADLIIKEGEASQQGKGAEAEAAGRADQKTGHRS